MNNKDFNLLQEAYIKVLKENKHGWTGKSGKGSSDYIWTEDDGWEYFANYSYYASGRHYHQTYDNPGYSDINFEIDIHDISRWKEGMGDAEFIYNGEDPKTLSPEAKEVYDTAIDHIGNYLDENVEVEDDDDDYNDVDR